MVLSHEAYNGKTGLALFCPITSKEKGYPFEVKVVGLKISGCVLSDQVKSLDWKTRNIEFVEDTKDSIIDEVLEKLKVLID